MGFMDIRYEVRKRDSDPVATCNWNDWESYSLL